MGPVGEDGAPQSRIYLQLAEPLAPDATPLVSMFGGAVLDRAGNPSNQDEMTAAGLHRSDHHGHVEPRR